MAMSGMHSPESRHRAWPVVCISFTTCEGCIVFFLDLNVFADRHNSFRCSKGNIENLSYVLQVCSDAENDETENCTFLEAEQFSLCSHCFWYLAYGC